MICLHFLTLQQTSMAPSQRCQLNNSTQNDKITSQRHGKDSSFWLTFKTFPLGKKMFGNVQCAKNVHKNNSLEILKLNGCVVFPQMFWCYGQHLDSDKIWFPLTVRHPEQLESWFGAVHIASFHIVLKLFQCTCVALTLLLSVRENEKRLLRWRESHDRSLQNAKQ